MFCTPLTTVINFESRDFFLLFLLGIKPDTQDYYSFLGFSQSVFSSHVGLAWLGKLKDPWERILFFTRDGVVSQRLKFGSAFLSSSWESKIALFFLTFPYPKPVPKNCAIFIGCNSKSRASQVGLHKQKKDTASAKKAKVRLQRRGGRRLKAVL